MRLVHYSHTPLGEVFAREQEPLPERARFIRKPTGLWVSDEENYGWKEWCEGANFSLGEYAYNVTLKPDHRVLLVGAEIELEHLQDRYGGTDMMSDLGLLTDHWIDWHGIAEQWQGVIISPYRWDRRLEHEYLWYYGWDCASGCIWNPEAIESITLITEKYG